jgi:putative ABC transport system permease protein
VRDVYGDLKHGIRGLLQSPGFTAAAVLILGVGIGANAAIFSMVNAVLLRDLPFRDPDRLVWVWIATKDRDRYPLSIPDFMDYRREARGLTDLAAVAGWPANLTGPEETERLQGARVGGNLFALLGATPALGRTLRPEDDREAARVVVLTHGLWQRRFGGDPAILGKALRLNGDSYAVVGVMPPRFFFPLAEAELAIPLAAEHDPWRLDRRSVNFLRVVARLRDGVTPAQAEAEMSGIARRLQKTYPASNATKAAINIRPYHEEVTGNYRLALWVILGAVGFVLLIGCANLAGLLLVRAASRRREMALRVALGATRGRLLRQLLTESLLLSSAGGVLGLVLSAWGLQALVALCPATLPRADTIGLDGRVLLFTLGVSALTGLLFGIGPAMRGSRVDPNRDLKDGRGPAGGAPDGGARDLLVAAEVALAMVLLAGAGLYVRSFARLQGIDPGFDAENVLVARLSLPRQKYARPEALAQFHDRLLPRLRTLPGIESVGVISILPLSTPIATADFWVADRPVDPEQVQAAHYRMISPDYLRTLRIRLVRGRSLTERDDARRPPVVLVNETLAARYFPREDPVGRHLMIDDADAGPRAAEIVGVVADVRHQGLDAEPVLDVYVPHLQVHADTAVWLANNQFWVLRAAAPGMALENAAFARAVRREVAAVDREVAASDIRPLEAYVADSIGLRRFNLRLVAIFAATALMLAAMGLYGLVAYSVGRRTREIGIRVALGARRGDILGLILGAGLRVLAIGMGAGLCGALALTRLLQGLLFGVRPHDPATFAAVAGVLGAVALLASWIPARRAARIDPARALRTE